MGLLAQLIAYLGLEMIIRKANRYDVKVIIKMLNQYKRSSGIDFIRTASEDHVEIMLDEIICGKGFVLLACKEGIEVGLLVAAIMPSAWSPRHNILTEMAYWVDPEYRGGTAGYRLLREYIDESTRLKNDGRINCTLISKMATSPDLKYDRFGFKKLEEFWVM